MPHEGTHVVHTAHDPTYRQRRTPLPALPSCLPMPNQLSFNACACTACNGALYACTIASALGPAPPPQDLWVSEPFPAVSPISKHAASAASSSCPPTQLPLTAVQATTLSVRRQWPRTFTNMLCSASVHAYELHGIAWYKHQHSMAGTAACTPTTNRIAIAAKKGQARAMPTIVRHAQRRAVRVRAP